MLACTLAVRLPSCPVFYQTMSETASKIINIIKQQDLQAMLQYIYLGMRKGISKERGYRDDIANDIIYSTKNKTIHHIIFAYFQNFQNANFKIFKMQILEFSKCKFQNFQNALRSSVIILRSSKQFFLCCSFCCLIFMSYTFDTQTRSVSKMHKGNMILSALFTYVGSLYSTTFSSLRRICRHQVRHTCSIVQ